MGNTAAIVHERRNPMPAETTVTRLKFAAGLVIFFGVLIALGAHPATAWPVTFLADLIFWPLDGAQSYLAQETRVMSGIGGGVMAGWGVALWLVATRLYRKDPALARLIIAESIIVWFVVDSVASLAAGAPLNVLFNLGFLAIFLVPLYWPARTKTA
jgi:hypothetical protein